MTISAVSFIGSGNLATHLCKALIAKNVRIVNVFSRNFNHAEKLSLEVGAKAVPDLKHFQPVDLIIICVTDSAIHDVSKSIKNETLVVHTSGSTPMEVLNSHANYGVLYPFQTFSKGIELDFSKVPFFIEANKLENIHKLKTLAGLLAKDVFELNTEQRLKLHLAAVFASNFSNHMYGIARDILAEANLPFDLLHHLIQETTAKALVSGEPANVQTGPAVRGNMNIVELHKEILADKPLWQKIYTFVSNSIIERETRRKDGTF